MRWTQGEWEAEGHEVRVSRDAFRFGDGRLLALVSGNPIEAAANARVMAAAPALYEALCGLVDLSHEVDIERTPEWIKAIEAAKAAIEGV